MDQNWPPSRNLSKFKFKLCCHCCGRTPAAASSTGVPRDVGIEDADSDAGTSCQLRTTVTVDELATMNSDDNVVCYINEQQSDRIINNKRRVENNCKVDARRHFWKYWKRSECNPNERQHVRHSHGKKNPLINQNKAFNRTTCDMKNIWYYICSHSRQSSPEETVHNGANEDCEKDTVGKCSINKVQRGSSMPENVLLGLMPASDVCLMESSRQRYSVPTIIQKDKTEKAWERLMRMKYNEKKVKRKTSRLIGKSWIDQTNTGNAEVIEDGNNCMTESNNNNSYTVDVLNKPNLASLNYTNNVNVVVIIDSVSPTTVIDDISVPTCYSSQQSEDASGVGQDECRCATTPVQSPTSTTSAHTDTVEDKCSVQTSKNNAQSSSPLNQVSAILFLSILHFIIQKIAHKIFRLSKKSIFGCIKLPN